MEKRKALVIDDEEIVLNSVAKILKAENYEVDTTADAKTGIQWGVGRAYDMVLTDIRMPKVGGLIVLRDIKREKSGLPVIMITGYASIQSAVLAMKLGAADYIEKPFDPGRLTEAVAAAIEQAQKVAPEIQTIIHVAEVLRVLERAASDNDFRKNLLSEDADVLSEYDLTGPEKLAIITGDIRWIESQIGPLSGKQKQWPEARLAAEIW